MVPSQCRFANEHEFERAISDFEAALKLNPNDGNARKYLNATNQKLQELKKEKEDVLSGDFLMVGPFTASCTCLWDRFCSILHPFIFLSSYMKPLLWEYFTNTIIASFLVSDVQNPFLVNLIISSL